MISILSRVGVSSRRMLAGAAPVPAPQGGTAVADSDAGPWRVVDNPHMVEAILHDVAAAGRDVLLTGRQSPLGTRTRIVGIVGGDTGSLLIPRALDETVNRELVADGHVSMVTRYRGLPVTGFLDIGEPVSVSGVRCYEPRLPCRLLFSETREHLRVRLPQTVACRLVGRRADGSAINASVTDLAEGGIGVVVVHAPEDPVGVGETWSQVFVRGAESDIGPLRLDVVHTRLAVGGRQLVGAVVAEASNDTLVRLRRLLGAHVDASYAYS